MGLKISVAMCAYNAEAFVEQQIESILAQARKPDEMIVCDDGSGDRTVEIIRRTTRGCGFAVRVLQNPRNVGAARSFERVIGDSTGDIVLLCAADDVWFPERISAVIAPFAENSDVVMVYCDAVVVNAALQPTGVTISGSRSRLRADVETIEEALARAGSVQGPTIAFAARLKPFLTPFSDQCAEDRWISHIAHAVGEVRQVDRPLLYYRRHQHNTGGGGTDLDRVSRREWRRTATLAYYEFRVGRWEAIHRRLREIKASSAPLPSCNRLDEFIEATGHQTRFARHRAKLRGRTPVARLPGALSSLVRGDYRRYASGIKSFVLDLIVV